jgi:restriction system protein
MIPTYEQIMLPFLRLLSDGKEYSKLEVVKNLATIFSLTDFEISQLLPSGKQPIFGNRIGWARTYLKKASLIDSPRRAHYSITDRGRELLNENPLELKSKDLLRYPEFKRFVGISDDSPEQLTHEGITVTSKTPEEELESAFVRYRSQLASELLDQVKSSTPAFFEQLVIDLLTKMGYGGSRKDAGEALGRSGDGGVDGLIKEDRLGLDTIYIQAKKWENPVKINDVRDFAGALLYRKARKGIFITTSSFPKSADDFVKGIDPKVILIDGNMLADFMIENGVGLSPVNTYQIYRIDADYFEE